MSDLPSTVHPFAINGVIPSLAVKADLGPPRSETGIGALMPWADRLWMVTYPSNRGSGSGTGLFEIRDDFSMTKRPESVVGTYANRLIHSPSNQLLIGPHVIDAAGNVRTAEALVPHRLTATMEHLEHPESMVYVLSMEGPMWELDVATLAVRELFDVNRELGVEYPPGTQPHYKGGHTGQGRVVVANNTFFLSDWTGRTALGRLGEWDGREWRVLDRTAFNEVAGRRNMGQVIFATGWDRTSAILYALVEGQWQRYRLPKASHTWEQCWQTEWPRIREVETERYLMDASGMFYELSPVAFGGRVWGVKPICQHLRIIPDYCSWNGLLVLAGNQTTPNADCNLVVGQPQAGLWFGKTDDLWSWGRPAGWGGVWWDTPVTAGEPSDPFLMTGFEGKCLHLTHDADQTVRFVVEVDFLGDGSWRRYDRFDVKAGRYRHHEFPGGFSAHWVRVTPRADCTATAFFTYT